VDILWNVFDQTWRWTGAQVATAFGIIVAALIARRVLRFIIERAAKRLAQRTKTELDDLLIHAIQKPLEYVVVVLGIYLAFFSLEPPDRVKAWLDSLFWIPYAFLIAWTMFRCVNVLEYILRGWAKNTTNTLDDQLVPLIIRSAKFIVWILAILMILQNMGYSISGLIAGLGVGGLAVALAAQKTLADVFGSIMLLADRPFIIGDWVQSPDKDVEGTVERIGFRSTRIRTFDQTLVTIPNSRLADFVINNMSERPVRRVWITIGLTYDTPGSKMRKAVAGIDHLLHTHAHVDQASTILVRFTDFGSHSLNIMVYYFVDTVAWAEYLRIREDINLEIMEIVENLGLSIAFPTQTVHLHPMDTDRDGPTGP
jgi:MscS family membrane protein